MGRGGGSWSRYALELVTIVSMCNVSLFLLPPYPPFMFPPPSSFLLPLPPPSFPFLSPPSSQGKDDLRQDAVMQQVFVLVNRLLRKEPATCKRRLSIRTYKVGLSVCLSCVVSLRSVRLFFWSLFPSHNSPTPSPTLHTLSTHSPHTHILTIHSHPCLYSQPSHISLIPHSYPFPIPISTPSQVIPLSQRSGIVEWCEGTQPLGEYLIGPPQFPYQGAHYRYRPSDSSSMECRKKLMVGVAH